MTLRTGRSHRATPKLEPRFSSESQREASIEDQVRRCREDSTIRNFLHNDSYTGEWSWGKRRWRKVPGLNKRRYVKGSRPMAFSRPELRIVDADTWTKVQARLREVSQHYARPKDGEAKGRSVPGRASAYLFSSLLYCGQCGGKMVISGGSGEAYYRCETRNKRGLCENKLSVKESVLRISLLDEIRHRLASPEGVAHARKRIVERLGEIQRDMGAERRERRARLDKIEGQIEKLVNFITEGEAPPGVREKLFALDREKQAEAKAMAAAESRSSAPIKLPTPDAMIELALALEQRLLADVSRGREQLRRLFKDGRVDLIPQPAGYYIARSEILPMVVLTAPPPKGSPEERYTASSCAGRI